MHETKDNEHDTASWLLMAKALIQYKDVILPVGNPIFEIRPF